MKKSIWILGCVLLLLLLPSTALAAADDQNNDGYHDGDVAVVNNIIDNNGLQAAKDAPESWDFVVWDGSEPNRIWWLKLNEQGLRGNLQITDLKGLSRLYCAHNELTGLELKNLPGMAIMDCSYNQLAELNLNHCINLVWLYCNNNQLKTLNLPNREPDSNSNGNRYEFVSSMLYEIDCSNNQLSNLDASYLPNLKTLKCNNNVLTDLNLENIFYLKTLDCSNNQLKQLDISTLFFLQELNSENNLFSEALKIQQQILLQLENKYVYINGYKIDADVAPIMVNNRVMVPIRTVTEAFNGKAEWNETAQRVTLCFDDREISMTIGSTQACVETTMEKAVELDVAPLIRDGRTYVPIRFVAEALDAQVQWSGEEKTILITK